MFSQGYVLYYEFETRGIFTGYVDGHFGQEALQSEPLLINLIGQTWPPTLAVMAHLSPVGPIGDFNPYTE